jgi:hypothetical protein
MAANALYANGLEFVPFWCPRCRRSYRARRWESWDLFDKGFLDEKRGRCPKEHERKRLMALSMSSTRGTPRRS